VKLTQWDEIEVDGVLQKRSSDAILPTPANETTTMPNMMSVNANASTITPSSPARIRARCEHDDDVGMNGGFEHHSSTSNHSLSLLYQVLRLPAPEFLDDAKLMDEYRRKCPREGLAEAPMAASLPMTTHEGSVMCEICFDGEQTGVLLCGHGACAVCWETYTHMHRTDERLTCMQCPSIIDSIARSYFSPSSWPATVRRLALEYVDPGYSACVGCGRYFKSTSPVVQCSGCHKLTCGLCEKACHWPLPCGDVDRSLDVLRYVHRTMAHKQSIKSSYRPCPRCRSVVQEKGNHFMCKCKKTVYPRMDPRNPEAHNMTPDLYRHLQRFKLDDIEKACEKLEEVRRKLVAVRRERRRRVSGEPMNDFYKLTEEVEVTLPLCAHLFVCVPREGCHHELKHFLKDALELIHFRLQGALGGGGEPQSNNTPRVTELRESTRTLYTKIANKLPPLVSSDNNNTSTSSRCRSLEEQMKTDEAFLRRENLWRRGHGDRMMCDEAFMMMTASPLDTSLEDRHRDRVSPVVVRPPNIDEDTEDPEWFGDNLAALLDEGIDFDIAWEALAQCKGNLEFARELALVNTDASNYETSLCDI